MNYKKIQKLLLVGLCTFSGLLLASAPAAPMHSELDLDAVMTAAEKCSRDSVDDFLVWRANGNPEIIDDARRQLAAAKFTKVKTRYLFSPDESIPYLFFYNGEAQCSEVLNWCLCKMADINLRKEYVEQLVGLYEGKDVSKAICHVEFGSGYLKQLFITAQALASRGFKNVQLIGIDPVYGHAEVKEYCECAFQYLWGASTGAYTLKLYASNDEFLASFHDDFPGQLFINSLSIIDLPPAAYADLRTCIECGPLSEDTNVVFADLRTVSITKPEILSRLTP